MTTLSMNPAIEADPLTARTRATWISGDFSKIAESYAPGAVEFVNRLNLRPNEQVLDVACGSGNQSIPAARTGAAVTGIDIAPNLIEQAQKWAHVEKLDAHFEVGDAEQMPYGDGSFDTVMTMFGAMFAPRPDRVAAELLRVTQSGGRIVMANWMPDGFIGQMFKITGKHVTPPAGVPSPLMWGNEAIVAERICSGLSELKATPRTITFTFPFDPAATVDYFRAWYGPTLRAFATLETEAQQALRSELVEHWTKHNYAKDGTTKVDSTYLEVVAMRK